MDSDDDLYTCDYCRTSLPEFFYLRAVRQDGSEIIVKSWCGNCDTPDDVNHEAQQALKRTFRSKENNG